jgi:hypothetical protein
VSFLPLYLDFVIEIDHTALLEMLEKASSAKNRKFSNGLIAIKVDNVTSLDPTLTEADL